MKKVKLKINVNGGVSRHVGEGFMFYVRAM